MSKRRTEPTAWIALDAELRPSYDGFDAPEQHPAAVSPDPVSMPASRRGFLKALGLSAASLSACERLPVNRAVPYLVPPEEITPGVPTYYATTCGACPASCGVVAKVLDGRPVKLEGNPDHPISRGGLCAIGQADLRGLYDPTRLQRPSVEGGAVEWEQLDARVRQRLEAVARSGLGVWVLSPTIVSPAAREAVQSFLAPFNGRLVEYDLDPQRPAAAVTATRMLTGQSATPTLRLDRVDLLVSFGADLFGTGADPVGHTAGWARRRRAGEQRGAARHLQIEGSLSLTGANADERWMATAAQREQMAVALLRAVAARTEVTGAAEIREALPAAPQEIPHAEGIEELATALVAVPGRSLLVTASDSLREQLAVGLLNRLLGNEGNSLDTARQALTSRSDSEGLAGFLDALGEGNVGAAIFVEFDAIGRLPGGAALADSLVDIPLSIGVFGRPTATAEACQIVAAAHHSLERWADAEPQQGVRTLAQPLVRPLFDTRDPWANFIAWGGEDDPDWGFELQDRWKSFAPADGPTPRQWWNEMVRTAGLAAVAGEAEPGMGTRRPSNAAGAGGATPPPEVLEALRGGPANNPGGIEIELITEISCRSGDHAANPWLRELPDPLTRIAWTPCARVAPSLAEQAGIRDGDIVEVSAGDATVRLPAAVLPGQHPDVVAVPVGYAAWSDDPAADPLPTPGAPDAAAGLVGHDPVGPGSLAWRGVAGTLVATGTQVRLPQIQVHAHTEGRPIIHQVSGYDEEVHEPHHPDADLWRHAESSSPHWEMTIDLDLCVGCGGCVVACQAENNIPVVGPDQMARRRDMHWLRVDRYFEGDPEDPEVLFEPMLCAQCDHAPCETVCPVAATVHSEDGLNQQIYNRCVGTRYCANNCPYKVRRFNWYDFQPEDPVERLVLNPDVVVRSRGVMEKCTFCVQRIQAGRIEARRTGRPEFDVLTACQQSCPAQAIQFGDGTDADSAVAHEHSKPRAFQVLADLGVRPSITYLARVRSRSGDGAAGAGGNDHGGGA